VHPAGTGKKCNVRPVIYEEERAAFGQFGGESTRGLKNLARGTALVPVLKQAHPCVIQSFCNFDFR